MRRKLKQGLFGALLTGCLCGICLTAFAGSTEKAAFDVNRADIPKDAAVLITVEGKENGLDAVVRAYVRTPGTEETKPGAFQLILSTEEGKLGRKGLGKEKEGDEKTPVGVFQMNTPFGVSKKLDGFPENYLQVDERYYWNGDSDSSMYNRLVRTDTYTAFDKKQSEHLIKYAGDYNYAIDTGYNPEGVPGKGSALFLHCSMGRNTGGCIAVPEEAMIQIMRLYQEGKTWIAIAPKDGLAAFEKD